MCPVEKSSLQLALSILDESREIVLRSSSHPLQVDSKSDGSLVSAVDRAVEELARDMISQAMSEAGVVGEEFGHPQPDAEFQWVIDPIDGTADFVRGIPLYGTVLALFRNQEPIVGALDFPALGGRYWASLGSGAFYNGERIQTERSPRRDRPIVALPSPQSLARSGLGFSALDTVRAHYPDSRTFWTCYSQALASIGQLDASVELNLHLWDIASAPMLARESGRAFRWLVPPTPWASGACSAVLGDPYIVDHISELLGDLAH